MKCPSCSDTLPAGAESCPGCGAVVAPPVLGALAPKPRTVTPPPRDKVEPLRNIPGLPRRERTWRDEVQERVRKRRTKRAQSSLPLFEQPEVTGSPEAEAGPGRTAESAAPTPASPEPLSAPDPGPESARLSSPAPQPRIDLERAVLADADFEAPPLSDEELADLPLRSVDPPPEFPNESSPEAPPVQVSFPPDSPPGLEEDLVASDEEYDDVSLSPPPQEPSPLERPARVGERAQAAAVDAGVLVVLGALVVYFTGRAARADVVSLVGSWPWLASYLAFLGLFYAGYFTGTTGQTPGKMVTGLRVVDSRGRPPGYLRSAGRALVGAVGTGLAGLGLVPMVLDPARRALHDRLLRTRVVHR